MPSVPAAQGLRLTRRGGGLLSAAVLCLVAGLVLGFPLLRLVAGAAVAVVVVAVLSCVRRVSIDVHRELVPDRVERGDAAAATLTLTNRSKRRSSGFTAIDPPTEEARLAVPPLAPGASKERSYRLPTQRRGVLTVGPLTVRRADLLGLVVAEARGGSTSTLLVHPRRHRVGVSLGAHPRHHHEGVIAPRPMAGSTDLRAVREYVLGDELRHVHWRATAKTGRMMVREYVDPAQPRFTVLLDDRMDAVDEDGFEAAVEIAASLTHASAAAGTQTRLLTTTGLDLHPGGGLPGSRVLQDALCAVEQGGEALNPEVLVSRCDHGTSLVLLGGGFETAFVGALRRRAREMTLFDFGAAGTAPVLPGVTVIKERDAVVAAAAWNRAVAA
ncbi:DUF58 domain-containing protein [Amycolatopsis sp. NPDC004169]|uniref:DUF58 domain-containing protein n=1 Tax=Amycolatopsis sp. NPDC004169 TaxID=3154453 RepID=UPI0033BAFBD5